LKRIKVIELARDPKLAIPAANVLKEPLLVGKANGTLIVQKQLQRGCQDPKSAVNKWWHGMVEGVLLPKKVG
jgi:hypothetical protein